MRRKFIFMRGASLRPRALYLYLIQQVLKCLTLHHFYISYSRVPALSCRSLMSYSEGLMEGALEHIYLYCRSYKLQAVAHTILQKQLYSACFTSVYCSTVPDLPWQELREMRPMSHGTSSVLARSSISIH